MEVHVHWETTPANILWVRIYDEFLSYICNMSFGVVVAKQKLSIACQLFCYLFTLLYYMV